MADSGISYIIRIKVLAPAATETNFGKIAGNVNEYDYETHFTRWHTSGQMAEFLLKLYDSDCVVGKVDRNTFQFELCEPIFPYAGKHISDNGKITSG